MASRNEFKKYLLWFANEHVDFRLSEIKSLIELFKVNLKWVKEPTEDPFWIVEVESEESVCQLASRSVSLRYAIELWGEGASVDTLHDRLKRLSHAALAPFTAPHLTFKIKVETFCNSQTQAEKVDKIESLSYLPLEGRVKLKDPDVTFHYIELYGKAAGRTPRHVFFGRQVAQGQRDLIAKLSLKTRKFIGNTSMDPQLSLLMANQAQVSNGHLVFDPFVGTGSLLVAAAQFGGYVLGTDIDYLMIHGKSRPTRKQHRDRPRKEESILNNMEQYNLRDQYVDVVVADSSLPLWRDNLILDAVITDPPYGIREAMERVGTTKSDVKLSEAHAKTHIPSKVEYTLSQLLKDLLSFSAKHLRLGGKLVTWLPIIRSEYDEKKLPQHECLTLTANSEQVLSVTSSRRLLTYTKVKHLQEGSQVHTVEEELSFREKYYKRVEELRQERKLKQSGVG